jgi:hypothetical protein
MIAQFMNRLPIPNIPDTDKDKLADLAQTITHHAQTRYDLHRQARRRLLSDLGPPDGKLNQKLTAWWDLDFRRFRQEVQKAFKRDIPLAERDAWETWLSSRQAQHRAETAAIVRGEQELNERVYGLFKLTAGEVRIIEASTKYQYGEV